MKKHKIIRKAKIILWKMARSRDHINEIALGAAIGTFISVFPTFGFGTLLVIVLSRFIKFNLLIAFATSVISNPVTSPFFMFLSYKVGTLLLGNRIEFDMDHWKSNLNETGITIIIGSFIVSGFFGIVAFFVSKFMVTKYRRIHKKK